MLQTAQTPVAARSHVSNAIHPTTIDNGSPVAMSTPFPLRPLFLLRSEFPVRPLEPQSLSASVLPEGPPCLEKVSS